MKRFLTAISILVLGMLHLKVKGQEQNNSIVFTYDNSGNMIQRNITVLPPPPGGRFAAKPTVKDTTIQFKVYPNPTNQYLIVEGELPKEIEEAKVQISNINGQILKTNTYDGQRKTFDVSDLKDGLYLLEIIYSKNKKSTYKIIINN